MIKNRYKKMYDKISPSEQLILATFEPKHFSCKNTKRQIPFFKKYISNYAISASLLIALSISLISVRLFNDTSTQNHLFSVIAVAAEYDERNEFIGIKKETEVNLEQNAKIILPYGKIINYSISDLLPKGVKGDIHTTNGRHRFGAFDGDTGFIVKGENIESVKFTSSEHLFYYTSEMIEEDSVDDKYFNVHTLEIIGQPENPVIWKPLNAITQSVENKDIKYEELLNDTITIEVKFNDGNFVVKSIDLSYDSLGNLCANLKR